MVDKQTTDIQSSAVTFITLWCFHSIIYEMSQLTGSACLNTVFIQ